MYPAVIEEYVRPATVAEALSAIARYDDGEAIFLAGGQSAMQALKSRMLRPRCIVDLQSVAELTGISNGTDGLIIGAMTRYVDIAEDESLAGAFAALRDAAGHIGDRQVRNRGTIGGSVCWNYFAACMPAVVLALDGTMNLASATTTHAVTADDFLRGALDTARAEGELLVSVSWRAPPPRCGSAYKKWGLVQDALPVIGVCVRIAMDDGDRCSEARITLAGLADGSQRAPRGEDVLTGSTGDDATIAVAMDAIAKDADVHSDQSADADYRRLLIRTLGREVATFAFARARG